MANESLFASPEVWNQYLTTGQANLVQSIIDHWPAGVCNALDVGCGDGKITHALADRTATQFHGFDGSKEALSRLHVPCTHGDVSELPFPEGSFDLVLSTDTLEHLPDNVENQAWAEMFRVAKDWVFVAVPFQEELLEATARCANCGKHYHVNWHRRAYNLESFSDRAPHGWKLAASILTGESWSSYLFPEIFYRRKILDEWSGWSASVCQFCGAPGSSPNSQQSLDECTALALGAYTYRLLNRHRFNRSHTEILAIFGKTSCELQSQFMHQVESVNFPASIWTSEMGLASNLDPYPQTAQMVPATEGGYILQMPLYTGSSKELQILGNREDVIKVSVEDSSGIILSQSVSLSDASSVTLTFPSHPTTTYYGLLIKISSIDALHSVFLKGECPQIAYLFPPKTGCGYFQIPCQNVFVQTKRTHWVDFSSLSSSASFLSLSRGDFFLECLKGYADAKHEKLNNYSVALEQECKKLQLQITKLEQKKAPILTKFCVGFCQLAHYGRNKITRLLRGWRV
jgi:ubiquinone/menaquinone biosynthesis C-methylase UbiE